MALAGLAKADKPALQALCELLGDDLSGNGWGEEVDATMSSSKADLAIVIEQYVKCMMEENVELWDELKLTKEKLEDCFKILTNRTK